MSTLLDRYNELEVIEQRVKGELSANKALLEKAQAEKNELETLLLTTYKLTPEQLPNAIAKLGAELEADIIAMEKSVADNSLKG